MAEGSEDEVGCARRRTRGSGTDVAGRASQRRFEMALLRPIQEIPWGGIPMDGELLWF